MKRFILPFLLIAFSLSIKAQDESKFGIKFSGFVKNDIFFDSRQTVNIREGHFLLYPDSILKDSNGKDINAKQNFNILSIQSRLKGMITGPDAFGAKTSGVLEADFFGNENSNFSDVNGFRLRHAFVKMSWKKTEVLVGQYWHPMFIAESFPSVISFNTGSPFQPFSRNPQLRLTHKLGQLQFILCAYSQRDFTSTGPTGPSSKYIRNSGIPDGHFQIQFKPDSAEHQFNAGADYKILKPELYTTARGKQFITNTTIGSFSGFVSAKMKFKSVTFKIYGVYAQNAYDLTMIGGYAVAAINDTSTGNKKFTNLNTISSWLEVQTNGKKIQYGLFAGYSKNLGSVDSVKSSIYARGSNIGYVYRIAPRIVFISGKLNIALEGEYTCAMYGIVNGNKKGGVKDAKAVSNYRGLLAFIYNF